MFDLKTINSVVQQLEEERGIPKDKTLEAIAMAHDLERNALVIKLLVNDVHQILRKSSLIQRTMRGNPLLAESDGKSSEWSAL